MSVTRVGTKRGVPRVPRATPAGVAGVALLLLAGAAGSAGLTAPWRNAHAPVLRLRGGAALSWSAISLSVDRQPILEDISGRAFEGRLLAIMGPSGAGKTSLLHVLGGMLAKRPGQVLRGGLAGEAPHHAAAFVGQDDNFHSYLTVEETLMLAASLRIPGATRAERRDAVDQTLRQLHLTHTRHTRVGNERIRGISGGERRRLALGEQPLVLPHACAAHRSVPFSVVIRRRHQPSLEGISHQGTVSTLKGSPRSARTPPHTHDCPSRCGA